MADSLDEQDKKDFGQGLLNMMLTEYPAASGAQGLQLLQFMQPAVEAAHITLDGRTLEEILERGRSIADDDAPAVADADGAGDAAEDSAEALRQCLQEMVKIDSAVIEEGAYSGHNVEVTVTNGLDWAIAGIRVAYQVSSEGRSVPWMDEDFSLSISGGIEPGETRTVRTTAFVPADAPEELITHAQVLDVSDQFERQLIRDVRVMGWGEERSEMTCESPEGT
ncbi:MAG: hypothetical protein WD674_10665 [Cucumibacter sp.]